MENELKLTRDDITTLTNHGIMDCCVGGKTLTIKMVKEELLIELHVPIDYKKSTELQIKELEKTMREIIDIYGIPCTGLGITPVVL